VPTLNPPDRTSNSQDSRLSLLARARYLTRLAAMHVARLVRPEDLQHLADEIEGYRDTYARLTGRSLRDAKVLELGFGQRPFRLLLMASLGYDVTGIDLDQPLVRLTRANLRALWERNGFVRTGKSALRRLVFDGAEYRNLDRLVRHLTGRPLALDTSRLVVGDASAPATWDRAGGRFDFIYSEDVFEHIPREQLPAVVDLMSERLSPDGLAIVSPMIFTGISGDHNPDWYHHRVDAADAARSPAWGHLTGEAVPADTFLNRMSRAEFRSLFQCRFVIEEETAVFGDLGRRHLTPERAERLAAYPPDELFSNKVRFVLRRA
jgi:2-polyprenyl-3-methyl-5-hydroxy-6-metoxy-1,4-benzoquinol methylase